MPDTIAKRLAATSDAAVAEQSEQRRAVAVEKRRHDEREPSGDAEAGHRQK
jgi:hypothetical protein